VTEVRLRWHYTASDERAGKRRPELLSVSIHRGVVPRSEMADGEHRADDLSLYKVVRPGDIVINRMRAFQGAVGLSKVHGIVSPDYLVLTPGPRLDGGYAHYLFRSSWFVGQMVARLRGIGSTEQGNVRTPRINEGDLAMIKVDLPGPRGQRLVAQFLDAETARIDTLIAKKRRLVELVSLRERRWASQRLRCQVSDLGAGGHGERLPLRRVASIHGGLTLGKRYDEPVVELPYLRVANVQDGRLNLGQVSTVAVPAADARRFAVRRGDVLVLEGNGNPENLGRGTVWKGEIEPCLHQNHVHVVRPDRTRLLPEYLDLVLKSEGARHFFTSGSDQVSIATLSQSRLGDLPIPMTSVEEQEAIVGEVSAQSGRSSALVAAIAAQVSLLGEHRQALITAAVTGELEVPGAAA
jgi:type I restriction enzyme S subunit